MVILNPTETSPGGGVCQINGGVLTNDHVLSPARGSPIVPSLPGAETYGLQNALKRWKALEQQSIPLENLYCLDNAQELIYARERKDFDDLRRRYFESKRSKMESSMKETPPPSTAASSKQTTIPIMAKQHQNANKILEQQQQMPNLRNFCDFNNPNFQTINNQINVTPMLNHNDFYNAQMPLPPIIGQQNFISNMTKERLNKTDWRTLPSTMHILCM
uniref:Uncharacterized protein n=1 Tax=Romanomermis culicivorax TaxID=13658 RepID=A0A915JSX7_ROMCU